MEGLATEAPAKNTTEDPAKNTTEGQAAASSSTRVVPSAKAAPTQAQLDEWANLSSEEKRHLMREAWKLMQGNRWKLGFEIFQKMQEDEDKEAL